MNQAPGFYWIRYTRGIRKGQLDIAHCTEFSWWLFARDTSLNDQAFNSLGIEVLARIDPPPELSL